MRKKVKKQLKTLLFLLSSLAICVLVMAWSITGLLTMLHEAGLI